MTKEQEAIEIVEGIVKSYIEADECGLSNNDFKHEIKALQTVLNMLKEKDKKMKVQEENYKNLIADVSIIVKELGLEEDGTIDEIYAKIKEKDKEIEKKDKIIYKMIDSFIDLGFGFEYCSNDDRCINDCDKCIKQYFEKLAKEKGE